MSFQFSDAHIDSYHTNGYVIFRGILPPALVTDLRRATDKARQIARDKRGQQTQRLQPIAKFEVDRKPFQDYAELSEIRDAIRRLLGPSHQFVNFDLLGVLLEPGEMPYCTAWHRDWRDNMPGLRLAEWDAVFRDINYFNQVNCALYEDTSTWVVPGSHLRRDLPGEARSFAERPLKPPDLEGKTSEQRERICLEYCERMPGAERLCLDTGDLALYRNTLWHLGNYVPYRKRATLHDVVDTPEFASWRGRMTQEMEQRKASGLIWENPNPTTS